MVLLLKTARDHGRAYFFWTLGLLAMVGIELSVYPTIRRSATGLTAFLNNYPEALKQIFRMEDYTSGPGFLSTELFSMMLPLVFISIGASWGSNASAQEEERRTADILFTLPVSRVSVLRTKIVSAILAQMILALILIAALFIGDRFVNLNLSLAKVIAGALTCALLGILLNAAATCMGAVWGKKSIALGGAIGLAIAGFLFYSLAPIVHTFDRIMPFNPFQWTLGSRPLYDGIDWGYTVFVLLLSAALYVASLFVFRRRDIQA